MLWGFSLQFWQTVVFWLWATAAITGGVAVAASFGSSVISYYISDETQRVADAATARADATAGQAKEGAALADERAGKANENAGMANERAAKLEVEAAEARERAATMEARVAELNLQIERIRQPRRINDDQIAKMLPALSRCSGTTFDLSLIPSDPEAAIYADRIERILAIAGWKQLDWKDGNLIVQHSPGGIQRGIASSTGLIALYPIERQAEMLPLAACFKGAFDAVDAPAEINVEDWKSTEEGGNGPLKDRLHIYVGRKPT